VKKSKTLSRAEGNNGRRTVGTGAKEEGGKASPMVEAPSQRCQAAGGWPHGVGVTFEGANRKKRINHSTGIALESGRFRVLDWGNNGMSETAGSVSSKPLLTLEEGNTKGVPWRLR